MTKIAVIGAGFSGLSAAAYLSEAGHEVHVFEKNETAGGRARQFTSPRGLPRLVRAPRRAKVAL